MSDMTRLMVTQGCPAERDLYRSSPYQFDATAVPQQRVYIYTFGALPEVELGDEPADFIRGRIPDLQDKPLIRA